MSSNQNVFIASSCLVDKKRERKKKSVLKLSRALVSVVCWECNQRETHQRNKLVWVKPSSYFLVHTHYLWIRPFSGCYPKLFRHLFCFSHLARLLSHSHLPTFTSLGPPWEVGTWKPLQSHSLRVTQLLLWTLRMAQIKQIISMTRSAAAARCLVIGTQKKLARQLWNIKD